MPIPPLLFLGPRDAVRRVCDAVACTQDEAVAFLGDAWLAGTIVPRFVGPLPPSASDPRDADWFSGEIITRTHLQTSAIPIGGYDPFDALDREQRGLPPREYRYPMRTLTTRYPFKIDRRQLDAILAEAGRSSVTMTEPSVIEGGEPQPVTSQSEKAKLRRRVKEFLEAETRIEPPPAKAKADWRRLARQEFGGGVTDNLFDEVWGEAKLPDAWRAPGRRT